MPFIKAIRLGDFPGQAECLEYMLGALAPDMPAETLSDLKEAVYLREDTASTYLEDGSRCRTAGYRVSAPNTLWRG